ncbi:MAG: DNA methyltransferase [Chloroflexota bacterium]|nr:DNA methyltransferase [Chloroflexota bacterium]MDE2910606.1 DNA methyltransferase [Chloroflexota bacterium]
MADRTIESNINCALKVNERAASHIEERSKARFNDVPISNDWAFSEAKRTDTTYITHGYHRYPAKFIPQLARRLIEEYSQEGNTVLDPFCGCGTTLVESVVSRRFSYGFDINPISVMISMAKIRPLDPVLLDETFEQVRLNYCRVSPDLPESERIDYWYRENEKVELSKLFQAILDIDDIDVRRFFVCGFSNILKNCSIWNQKSNKPTRDFKKNVPDVMRTFNRQIRMMIKGNSAFRELIDKQTFVESELNGDWQKGGMVRTISANVDCRDSRSLPLVSESVDLVVTSPPYVTSYEYGDLHQLSMLWLEGLEDLRAFRETFIGSALRQVDSGIGDFKTLTHSSIAAAIGKNLISKNGKIASSVVSYFQSMFEIWSELYRVLRVGSKLCIVIGNTSLKGVEIHNAEVFVEQAQSLNLRLLDVIKREIPSKNLPSTRDKATGRFAKATAADALAYPTEYILVLEKCH